MGRSARPEGGRAARVDEGGRRGARAHLGDFLIDGRHVDVCVSCGAGRARRVVWRVAA